MLKKLKIPCALTIAGSDSGGGAGIQADLKTFAALGVHGTSVITCLTAQNPTRVLGIQETSPALIRQQLEAVFEALPPQGIKTGMVFSAHVIREITRVLGQLKKQPPLIVDPVMISTSGKHLLKPSAIKALQDELFPMAALLTPNLPEAEALGTGPIREPEDLRNAARTLNEKFGCAVLLKGGHLKGMKESVDIFFDGETEWMLIAPRITGVHTHGTGCTYSAAIAACIARGESLQTAVETAKDFVSRAIAQTVRVATHDVLNWGF